MNRAKGFKSRKKSYYRRMFRYCKLNYNICYVTFPQYNCFTDKKMNTKAGGLDLIFGMDDYFQSALSLLIFSNIYLNLYIV